MLSFFMAGSTKNQEALSIPTRSVLESTKENRHPVYYGHLYYGVHQHKPGDCIYFTTVRDPVERVLSCY